jgi:hypothetical protein
MIFSTFKFVTVSFSQERQNLLHKITVVLKDSTVPGVFVDHQLRIRDAAGQMAPSSADAAEARRYTR